MKMQYELIRKLVNKKSWFLAIDLIFFNKTATHCKVKHQWYYTMLYLVNLKKERQR